MKKILAIFLEFYYFTIYSGIKFRRWSLGKKKIKKDVFELNLLFWMSFINAILILGIVMPSFIDKEEFVSNIDSDLNGHILFILYVVKFVLDYLFLFRKDKWLKIESFFDQGRNLIPTWYHLGFGIVAIIGCTWFMIYRWF